MNKEIILSKHFNLSEFTRSATATAKGIVNTPGSAGSPHDFLEVVSNLQQLCIHVLEPLREYANSISPHSNGESVGVSISSGYRTLALNTAVGGSKTSQHMTGEAADIHIPDEATGKRWFLWIMNNLRFDQLIWEKSTPTSTHHWIHVSFRQDGINRQQVIDNLVKNCR